MFCAAVDLVARSFDRPQHITIASDVMISSCSFTLFMSRVLSTSAVPVTCARHDLTTESVILCVETCCVRFTHLAHSFQKGLSWLRCLHMPCPILHSRSQHRIFGWKILPVYETPMNAHVLLLSLEGLFAKACKGSIVFYF